MLSLAHMRLERRSGFLYANQVNSHQALQKHSKVRLQERSYTSDCINHYWEDSYNFSVANQTDWVCRCVEKISTVLEWFSSGTAAGCNCWSCHPTWLPTLIMSSHWLQPLILSSCWLPTLIMSSHWLQLLILSSHCSWLQLLILPSRWLQLLILPSHMAANFDHVIPLAAITDPAIPHAYGCQVWSCHPTGCNGWSCHPTGCNGWSCHPTCCPCPCILITWAWSIGWIEARCRFTVIKDGLLTETMYNNYGVHRGK